MDSLPKSTKEAEGGDKLGEGNAQENLRNPLHRQEKIDKRAIDRNELLLKIAKVVGDKAGEGSAYRNLGIAHGNLGDFKTAMEYHEGHLKIAKEVRDRAGEGDAYGNLGLVYHLMGDFKTAVEYHERHLKITKEVDDRAGEGAGYGHLGIAYERLGDFKTSVKYHERSLKIAKEAGDKVREGMAYGNLGKAYVSLDDFKSAIEYYEGFLKIAKEVGDKASEGLAYRKISRCYHSLGDFRTAVDCLERSLKFAKEVGDTAEEGTVYSDLGINYRSLGDFKTALIYHQRSMKIGKEVEDKAKERIAYVNLGNVYQGLGNFKTAVNYYERSLKICKDVGDRDGEGGAYGNLGNAYQSLGDLERAIDCHGRQLEIAKEVGSKASEGMAYGNLGIDYQILGYYKTSVEYFKCHIKIAKEVGDRDGEGKGYGNLGSVYRHVGDLKTAIEYNERFLKIAKEIGDKVGESVAYSNLGLHFHCQRDFKKAIDSYESCLKIEKQVGCRSGEGRTYGLLGSAYGLSGDFKTGIDYLEQSIKIANEVGNKIGAAQSYAELGRLFELQRLFSKAIDCYHSSVKMFDMVRRDLKSRDEWKISYRDTCQSPYTDLWRLLLKQGKVNEALFAANQGRAQALNDLMEFNYRLKTTSCKCHLPEESTSYSFSFPRSVTVFIASDEQDIVFWIVQEGKQVELRKKEVSHDRSLVLNDFLESLIASASQQIGVRAGVKCEDRLLDKLRDEQMANERSPLTLLKHVLCQMNALRTLYDVIIDPIADLVRGDELILVPEGPLCLAPFAAFVDSNSKYLCDVCRIRVIPSLTSLKLITDSPPGYHSKTGVLLVGDPWVQEVVRPGRKLEPLPFARKEVQMIGSICSTRPLIGREATKDEVLRRLPSVALIHIAAHGRMDTGEIALAPNATRASQIPEEEDFLLTMKDVKSAQIRARLVVLSCCHSGHGEVTPEGVVGIARAFLGAGARAVVVTLWAVDDEATLQFMNIFYLHLVKGISASESLNKAMKHMRESDQFNEVKHWAPFVLIGDDVTLELGGSE